MLLREFFYGPAQEEGISDLAVIFHDELNPKLWDSNQLRKIVRNKLLQIAKNFIEFIDIPNIRLKDVTISGSNAAYTYTDNSDIDLHIVVDVPPNKEAVLRELFDAKKNQYNYNHDIKIEGIDVELYVQPSTDKHRSAGIYSVLNSEWLAEPQQERVNIDDNDVELKVGNYLNKIKRALRSSNIKKVTNVREELSKLRKTGLEREGEFSVENIAFKVLRAEGWIEKLRQHIYDLEDRRLSL